MEKSTMLREILKEPGLLIAPNAFLTFKIKF
jgi:hypothetical protein